MRLSTFIAENTEHILSEWEAFARSVPGGDTMDVAALRDHAKEMLLVIQRDLETPQSQRAQSDKSKGMSDATGRRLTAAQEHGEGRADSGFTMGQMLSEFRALRATVIRLWSKAQPRVDAVELEDVTRFNEAIDQAIAESVSRYTRNVDHSKEMFLAILGHDLRTPLGAAITSARFVLEDEQLAERHRLLLSLIVRSGTRMNQMIGDLLDFTRGRLGDGIPIVRGDVDLNKVCRNVVDEVAASHPGRAINLETAGDLRGKWDGDRITQALTNLLSNALQHGNNTSVTTVRAVGQPSEVLLTVHNLGPVIPKNQGTRIFDAMKQAPSSGQGDRRHLGLGLYIVERIVTAHDGTVDMQSSAQHGTTFSIHLPRAPGALADKQGS
jgi:signal transduction histidine kinase